MTEATILAPRRIAVGRKRKPPPRGRTARIKFARRLHALAEAADKSNKEIAEACGVSHVSVSRWMAAVDSPTFDNMVSLASVFGVHVRDLFPDD